MTRVAIFGAVALTTLAVTSSAVLAQGVPTAAQKHALRSACPADFRANCAGVPTGGMAALVCLEQHVDKLSPACQSAVKAVSGGSEEKKPSAAATPAAKKPAAEKAPESKTAAAPAPAAAPMPERPVMPFFRELRITARSCARDFRVLCPDVPLGHGNALFCLKVHANRLSEPCRAALAGAGESLE